MAKLFTIEEAEALIPRLQEELKCVRKHQEELKARVRELVQQEEVSNIDSHVASLAAKDARVNELMNVIRAWFEKITELSVECKGIDEGLFDFPCLLEDRIVYLCWKDGEERIEAWHEVDAGFSGRRPLLEATKRDRQELMLN